METMIDRYLDVLNLKDINRTGWEIYNVRDAETVAGHSWSLALLTLIHIPKELNSEKALKMALIHDIGESEIGDLPYRADSGPQSGDKEEEERQAVNEIAESLDSEEIKKLYTEYSERKTPEAEFVKDMDLIDMVLQALKYQRECRVEGNAETDYDNLDEFFETTRNRLNTDKGEQMFEEIEQKYLDSKN